MILVLEDKYGLFSPMIPKKKKKKNRNDVLMTSESQKTGLYGFQLKIGWFQISQKNPRNMQFWCTYVAIICKVYWNMAIQRMHNHVHKSLEKSRKHTLKNQHWNRWVDNRSNYIYANRVKTWHLFILIVCLFFVFVCLFVFAFSWFYSWFSVCSAS